jgi:hypothetical protein
MNAAIVENEIVVNVIVVDDINFMPNLVKIPEGKFIHIGDNINDMFDSAPNSQQKPIVS